MTTELSPEEKAKRAEENRKATDEANRMAMEARQRDQLGGARPVLNDVADSVRQKLEKQFPANPEGYEGGNAGEVNSETNN